ncbi:hypothetical protein [Hymenobacter terricola]|uniref:hypothetical protein n=1 Tax=Hymenobacter terricola TaxID=2819236 RepID=UPI001B30B572|nr:hypothetical protein [Hymenobacter terricola]
MQNLTVYCSQPASPQMATFLLAVQNAHGVVIRPVSELPAPDPLRRQQLRVERTGLLEAIAVAAHDLDRLVYGEVQPDAGRENGLRFELEALKRRLSGVNTVLGTEKGGTDNA